MTAAASPELPSRDGRRARRDRSRDQAVDALLELLDEGLARPTAQQVAERSGVSLRSIFRIFDDVDSLHSEAATRQLDRVRHLYVELATGGTLAERIESVVGFHDHLYSEVARVRRAGLRTAAESEVMRAQLQRARSWLLGEIQRMFGSELDGADAWLLPAVELALSFEAWDQLTSGQGLDVGPRQVVVRRTVLALFASRVTTPVPDPAAPDVRSPSAAFVPTDSLVFATIGGSLGRTLPLHRGRARIDGAGRGHPAARRLGAAALHALPGTVRRFARMTSCGWCCCR